MTETRVFGWLRTGRRPRSAALLAALLVASSAPSTANAHEGAPPTSGVHSHDDGTAPHSDATDASASARCTRPEEFAPKARLGSRVCDLGNGLFKVRTRTGDLLTHGIDRPAALMELGGEPAASSTALAATAIRCTTEKYKIQMIYAIPSDAPDRSSTFLPLMRNHIVQVNNLISSRASEFGVTMQLRVACDSSGQPSVLVYRSGQPSSGGDIAAIDRELSNRGWKVGGQDNIVYWGSSGCRGGVAWGSNDTRPGAENSVNEASGTALVYGDRCPYTFAAHEQGHSMGAVLPNAPNGSGRGHCNDDSDVMCYNDGGPRSGGYRTNVCPSPNGSLDYYWDCNSNDYFHPTPSAGSYLATNWNTASCNNRVITRSGCGPDDGGTLPTGYHQVVNRSSSKCLQVAGSSTTDGAAVTQSTCATSSALNQQWTFTATSGGYYRITARHSSDVIDITGASTANGAKAVQWPWSGGSNQQWRPVNVGGGYWKFIARHSNKAMEIPGCSTADGAQLQQYTDLNNACQSFRLVRMG